MIFARNKVVETCSWSLSLSIFIIRDRTEKCALISNKDKTNAWTLHLALTGSEKVLSWEAFFSALDDALGWAVVVISRGLSSAVSGVFAVAHAVSLVLVGGKP